MGSIPMMFLLSKVLIGWGVITRTSWSSGGLSRKKSRPPSSYWICRCWIRDRGAISQVPQYCRRLSVKLCHGHILFFNKKVPLSRYLRNSIHRKPPCFTYCCTEKNLPQRLSVVKAEVLTIRNSLMRLSILRKSAY